MTERERLYELIVDADNEFFRETPCGTVQERIEKTVEHLLSNGVILPPCKIGDEVYRISKRYGCWVVLPRYVDNLTFGRDYTGELVWTLETTTDDVLGNTVFLTREEAEAELEKRRKQTNTT